MTRYVALLRGVNLGGRNKLPMAELRALLDSLGYANVRTYIQSGNVVFGSSERDEARISAEMQTAIEREFGVSTPVVIRSHEEYARVLTASPYDPASVDPKLLHVMFLSGTPDPGRVARLDPERSPGDSFVVKDREIYLHFPNGAARSKLTVDYFDRNLSVVATARNWNTVLKLAEMLAED